MKRVSFLMWITVLMAGTPAFAQDPVDDAAAPDAATLASEATAPEAGIEAVEPAPGDTDLAKQIEQEERVRRQTRQIDAENRFDEGQELFRQGQFKNALEKYEAVLKTAPDRPASDELIRAARGQAGECRIKLAEAAYQTDNLAEAIKFAEEAKTSSPELADRADRLTARAARREARAKKLAALPVAPADQPRVIEQSARISQLFREGQQWFAVEDFDRAEDQFEAILLLDPFHRDAMRFLRKIEERRLVARDTQRKATIVQMTEQVRRRWTPPIKSKLAAEDQRQDSVPLETQGRQRALQTKMSEITIPSLDFRQANIVDVINFLREASLAADPDGSGVNILLKLPEGGAAVAAPAAEDGADPWATPSDGASEGGASFTSGPSVPAITLNLRNVTLLAAIKYVTEVAGLKYRIEEAAVIIYPPGVMIEAILTQLYPVMPTIMDVVGEAGDEGAPDSGFGEFTGEAGGPKDNLRAFFEKNGVAFPVGSSITYNSTISKLIVANTAENLDKFEIILSRINVIPSQVEIEARFVEINQNDLEELGFQWLLTDNWQIAHKNDGGMNDPSIQVDANATGAGTLGFTKGLRHMGSTPDFPQPTFVATNTVNSLLGNLLSVSGILTNPELTMVLHALDQSGGTDLLSAPRVTTVSGGNAQIQVVTEIIYPSEYEQQDIGDVTMSMVGITDAILRRPPLPAQFETRDTGIILNATPTVGPDGYSIDLTLVPEVSELIGWIDYGPPGEYPILQPVFDSRNAQTSVVIWDGATLTLGGMIREQVSRMDDKIPLLGDIPVLGRLFRSEGEYSGKKNMIIFVTARIIDPTGTPIRSPAGSEAEDKTAAK